MSSHIKVQVSLKKTIVLINLSSGGTNVYVFNREKGEWYHRWPTQYENPVHVGVVRKALREAMRQAYGILVNNLCTGKGYRRRRGGWEKKEQE